MRRLVTVMCLAATLAAGCGGSRTSITGETGTSGTGGTGGTGGTSGTTTVSMGSGTGSSFQSGIIAISTASLSAGGSTSLQVTLVDQTGAPYTTATTITFSSPCVGQGLATITGTGVTAGAVSTSTGTATATYVASGCSGSDVITASASPNSQTLTASGTVTVAQAAIGSISFVSAMPSTISLKGVSSTTSSGLSTATSTVIFKVLDTSGGPRAGATVNMSLDSTVGGTSLAPTTGTTDANGHVQTVVSGGTVATTVRVKASTTTASGSTISTESSALTVSTGIPTSANISLAVGNLGTGSSSTAQCYNVEAWNIDGVTVPVTVRMSDRFSNPVPDGTTATFYSTLGNIQPSCQTTGGACTVNWTSQIPYSVSGNPQSTPGNANTNPAYCPSQASPLALCNGTTNGRSPILAFAIGEESFVDATGNGVFNPSDTVAFNANNPQNNFTNGTPKPWDDTSEPFLNSWELGTSYADGTVFVPTYVLGEKYVDFNNDGKRNGPDGLVESALCEGPLCNTTESTVAISASNVIILATSQANITAASATPPALSTGGEFDVIISDLHNQQMASGTKVAISVLPTAATTIVTPTGGNYSWPCSTAVGGQLIKIVTSAGTTPGPGVLTIQVTSPGGTITTKSYNFN